ncbi:hypothetical protein HRQ91_03420 [Treponema parvum]|uniref:Uncharacterized protein n=1 Tax=Treponema parvum TaxID=138851 RepID=A0A975F3C1_9SPIR|nr:hypothetical protein [Treponema parvum]QTQ13583.1 hypothetical protein HRQ91_03420 [Treponema parvum]
MSKKRKKSAKQKYSTQKPLQKRKKYPVFFAFFSKLSEKQRFYAVFFCALVLFTVTAVRVVLYTARVKTTIVGFLGVPETYVETIRSVITEEISGKIKFKAIAEKKSLNKDLHKKTDILITNTGIVTEFQKQYALSLPPQITARYPQTVVNSVFFSNPARTKRNDSASPAAFCVMPLFTDHFEAAYLASFFNRANILKPENLDEFSTFIDKSRPLIAVPVSCAGLDDNTLIAFVSSLVEALSGRGYYDFVCRLKETSEFSKMLDITLGLIGTGKKTPLSAENPATADLKFSEALDILKKWEKEGMLLRNWYKAPKTVVTDLMNREHTAVILMLLSGHREQPFPMIKYYDAEIFPKKPYMTHGIIAPSVSALCFRNTKTSEAMLERLSSEAGQSLFSQETRLAPAALRGESIDMQADDVRFWAASLPGGPLPDIASCAFASEKSRADFVKNIRYYLSEK